MSGFWRSWVTVWCWAILGAGVLFAAGAFPATEAGVVLFYDVVVWPIDGAQSLAEPVLRSTVAILGAVMIGWALTMLALTRAAPAGAAPVWRDFAVAIVVWYLVDSALSVLTGIPLNAISNTLIVAPVLVALLAGGALRAPRSA